MTNACKMEKVTWIECLVKSFLILCCAYEKCICNINIAFILNELIIRALLRFVAIIAFSWLYSCTIHERQSHWEKRFSLLKVFIVAVYDLHEEKRSTKHHFLYCYALFLSWLHLFIQDFLVRKLVYFYPFVVCFQYHISKLFSCCFCALSKGRDSFLSLEERTMFNKRKIVLI